jgi:TIR domain/Effector-associated domain 9
MKDFFISYNKADKQWAVWIAWQLEEAGYSLIIQEWDFRPGGNFVIEMQNALVGTKKMIAVLSESYLNAEYTQPEWAAVFAKDPQSLKKNLLLAKVGKCEPQGLLNSLIYVSLLGVDEPTAREILLNALKDRGKPDQAPFFPGSIPAEPILPELRMIKVEPLFPSAASLVQQVKITALKEQLDVVVAEHVVVSEQINHAIDPIIRQRLERQRALIFRSMEEVSTALDLEEEKSGRS